ncbi:MAG: sensor histidine kinase [Terriglobales bacterium]
MGTISWLVQNGTAETLLIFNLFHVLLAGLTLLVLLYQLRPLKEPADLSDRLLAVVFALLVLRFALLTFSFGTRFFYGAGLQSLPLEHATHALLVCAFIILVATFEALSGNKRRVIPWMLLGCAGAIAITLLDGGLASRLWISGARPHSASMLMCDVVALAAIALSARAVVRNGLPSGRAYLAALALCALALVLHFACALESARAEVFLWEAEEVVLSASLFVFAWVVGERSPNLLDRIFVRLNLTFIVLASLIMLVTAGMEKYQYMRLAEQRSLQFAEFLRNEINRAKGEDFTEVLRHTSVSDRVIAEFANIPELRRVNVYLGSQQAIFGYTDSWLIKYEIRATTAVASDSAIPEPANSFQMVSLPLESSPVRNKANRIELLGTMDYIDRYIGKYIIFIYSVFTVVVVLATGIIGIIVAETDRQLKRKYTELEETHRQLTHAAKLASIGELAGGMAHEINTPITSILSLASHMAEDRSAPGLTARQRSSLQLIANQAERVSRIVSGLLNFSRQSQLHLSQVEVAGVLETAITLIQHRLDDHGIRLERQITFGLSVYADAGALTELVLNLLTNAIDAMPSGGTLVVEASSNSEGGVRLAVKDTGVGILPEQMPRIFDPFYTTKEPGRGTGLGLSVSHGIVKKHGGEIWAESEPGAGTTFVVVLPAEARV